MSSPLFAYDIIEVETSPCVALTTVRTAHISFKILEKTVQNIERRVDKLPHLSHLDFAASILGKQLHLPKNRNTLPASFLFPTTPSYTVFRTKLVYNRHNLELHNSVFLQEHVSPRLSLSIIKVVTILYKYTFSPIFIVRLYKV